MPLIMYGDATGNGIRDTETGASIHFDIDGTIKTNLANGKKAVVLDAMGNSVAEHGGQNAAATATTAKLVGAAGANKAGANAYKGADVEITAGNGGNSITSGNGNGGNGGDVKITAGTKGTKHGSGSDGANGNIIMASLPTSDPHVAGALYNDTGTVKVSAG